MVARPPIGQQWTVEQYLEMERASIIRHELVDGRVYAMAGGDQDHGSISINVCAALADRLDGRPCRVFNTDMKVRLANEQAFVYPDASVTCDPRDLADRTADFIRFPCLVVEVLSASTERYDRGAKYDLYRGRGVLKEYMLVETRRQVAEVRTRRDDGSWTTVSYGRGDDIGLGSVGLTIPLAALYRGITF